MSNQEFPPVHIRAEERARPPGKAGEAIVSRFEDIAHELSRAMAGVDTSTSAVPFPVRVEQLEQSFQVSVDMGAPHATVEIGNGLIHVRDLPGKDGGQSFSRSFVVPDDLERSLVQADVKGGSLRITLPRTPETTRSVRQLERGSLDGRAGSKK